MERENADDSGATNTSSSLQNVPKDITAQVEQKCRKGRQEKDDVSPPSPIQNALEQVSCCTSHNESQCCMFIVLFIKHLINLDDVYDSSLRESHFFLFLFCRWFQKCCSPQETPPQHKGLPFCLILCLALPPHLSSP